MSADFSFEIREIGVLPIMVYTGRLRPKGVPFFRLQVYQRVGIPLVVIYERVGLWKGRTDEFYGFTKWGNVIFL